jgi:LytTr DNA-binding domain.
MLEDENSLLRCHKGYIINPKMIEKLYYANNTISLKYAEEVIPIGKIFKNDIDLLL